jgi:hypothetical protein
MLGRKNKKSNNKYAIIFSIIILIMKSLAIFFLFIGIILVIQAYYKNMSECPEPETIIKYVPRSIYEEQLSDEQKLTEFYKVMFDGSEKKKNPEIQPEVSTRNRIIES